jgi:Uma2 family endonuclease
MELDTMTAVLAPPTRQPARSPHLPLDYFYRLSVEQYHAMIRFGILTEDDPVELLEGCLVLKMGINPKHWYATGQLRDWLIGLGLTNYFVHSQEPIVTDDSEPEPDVAVVRGKRLDYFDVSPSTRGIALVVEVSDSTLLHDRTVKKRIYARAGIPIYWIVNLIDQQIEVYTQPTVANENWDYASPEIVGRESEVRVVLDGREAGRLPVQKLMPFDT